MTRQQQGFTLIELMIVIAIIAIIAAIAIPNLMAARLAANETTAVATLRSITAAQAQFKQGGRADTDADGAGEYGGFVEMSGGGAGRMVGAMSTSVLSGGYRVLDANGQASRSGYIYQIFLPGPGGGGVSEPGGGYANDGTVDADNAEIVWCCYAWPTAYGQTGHRTYLTNQSGDILKTDNSAYSGPGNGPASDAGFQDPDIGGQLAIGQAGQDGPILWKQTK